MKEKFSTARSFPAKLGGSRKKFRGRIKTLGRRQFRRMANEFVRSAKFRYGKFGFPAFLPTVDEDTVDWW